VWAVVAVLAVDGMLWSAWSALGPVVAKQRLGGAAAWGTVLAVFGLGALLGGLAAMRARPSRPLLVFALSGVAIAVPLGCLAAAAPLPVLAAGALLAGAAIIVANSVWESTLQCHIPAESLSRVSAYDWFGSMALGPLGLIMWGPIAAAAGLGPALWIAFGVHLATAALLAAIPDIRRLPASPPPPASPSPAADLQPRMPPAGQSADTTTAAESPCPPRAGERGNPSGREDAAAGRIAGTEPA
jgi:MFS family permease